ncbi:hypothetical protein [Methylomagnum ishizawai]|uniref:hypothetical protein n=1 Tax=Methylomagnum ishizawai TaxID=1760988 RepID=UPI000F738C34|nr:hypothetical protein [Methylomagnum ishizawai]
MALQSYWSVMYVGPHHGVFLKKLERLAGFTALELERERFIMWEERVEHTSFLVEHRARTWPELIVDVLHIAQRVCPAWKLVMGNKAVVAETGPACSGVEGYTQRISGTRTMRWEINEAQYYNRMRWLSGQPNRW